jgi:GNAT superfamily N-acetyltransferase
MAGLTIRVLVEDDLDGLVEAVRDLGGSKPRSQYQRYFLEQQDGRRTVLVAVLDGSFAGYVMIDWVSSYPPFGTNGIPEIQDFNVFPRFRRRGIGTRLMDEAERLAARRSSVVGIGVGLSQDYGPAQRLYVLRGFVPDGRGLHDHRRTVPRGARVTLDDGLALYLTKDLHRAEPSGSDE